MGKRSNVEAILNFAGIDFKVEGGHFTPFCGNAVGSKIDERNVEVVAKYFPGIRIV